MADREGDVLTFGRLGLCLGIGQPRGGPSYNFGEFCVGQPPSYIFDEFGFGQSRGGLSANFDDSANREVGRLKMLTIWGFGQPPFLLSLTSWALANREGGVSTF